MNLTESSGRYKEPLLVFVRGGFSVSLTGLVFHKGLQCVGWETQVQITYFQYSELREWASVDRCNDRRPLRWTQERDVVIQG